MHESGKSEIFKKYRATREWLITNPDVIIDIEEYVSRKLWALVSKHSEQIKSDYDLASRLYPFWQNYPPDERGRQPIGDQFPWIEVGEHSVGTRVAREIATVFEVSDMGFPTGTDQRFLLSSNDLAEISNQRVDCVWLCLDIKSVGPRDDSDHAVMSHNQISGSGEWHSETEGISNSILMARGKNASHEFFPALPPLLVLPDGSVAIVATLALKPVYSMLYDDSVKINKWKGQPLHRIDGITIPNGLLLTKNPGYLDKHPGLIFPGKDDKTKNPKKLRARVSFEILRNISDWRHTTIKEWPSS